MSNLKDFAEGFVLPKPRKPLARAWINRSPRTPRTKPSRDERKVIRDDIPATVRAAVKRRSGGRCEIKHPDCWGEALHMHHRKMRSQGGPHTVDNILHVCLRAHFRAHHDSDRYERGWLIRSTDEITPFGG